MLDKKQIGRMLKQAGLGRCNISSIGSGHYNDSYYIYSDKGRFVLRIAPLDSIPKLFYEIDMMKSEVTLHRLAREHTDIPVARIVYHDFSKQIIERDYLIMEYIEGKPGWFDEQELGRYVRQLHSIKGDCFGYPQRAAPTGENWPDIFHTYVQLIFNDCSSCGVIDKSEYERFLSVYERHRDVVTDVEPCLLHLDLWHQNILTVNGTITAILDFDRGLFGDTELEFAVLDTYGYSSPEFFKGYGRLRPTGTNAKIRQRLYIVYEIIKYAFIRVARGRSMTVGRSHVTQCQKILNEIE